MLDNFSIEDAKQKSEHDKMMKRAEEKKMGVKYTIEKLRHSFRKLLEKNGELPPHLRLDRKVCTIKHSKINVFMHLILGTLLSINQFFL